MSRFSCYSHSHISKSRLLLFWIPAVHKFSSHSSFLFCLPFFEVIQTDSSLCLLVSANSFLYTHSSLHLLVGTIKQVQRDRACPPKLLTNMHEKEAVWRASTEQLLQVSQFLPSKLLLPLHASRASANNWRELETVRIGYVKQQ